VEPLRHSFAPCPSTEHNPHGCTIDCVEGFFFRRTTMTCGHSGTGFSGARVLRSFRVTLQEPAPPLSTGEVDLFQRLRAQFLEPLKACWEDVAREGLPPPLTLSAGVTTTGTVSQWLVLGPEGPYRSCVEARMPELRGPPQTSTTGVRLRAVAWANTDPPQSAE
jgi:hypothetical protein